ncbi:histone H1.3-like [Bactrocera tryoni]|uniref:histone H1.3-like n=1 Tax=Bactrocera tryoni TaxID=59916 RepID=UPI001A961D23|nr:histone H1.3-like [Bactrocera tryoni]
MKKHHKNIDKPKQMLKSDLEFLKRRPANRSAHECVQDNSSGITSWSSNACLQYRKFSAEALVLRALKGLCERNGSSVVAVKKFIINHYPYVDGKFTLPVIRRVIKKALLKGKIVQSQGKNMEGLFKISAGEIRAEQQQQQFKHLKECIKLREQQKQELQRKMMKCRARDIQRHIVFEENQAAQRKRRKEVASAAKAAKASLTAEAAREILSFAQQQTGDFVPSLRLDAGTSKGITQRPQIVDYADAALETAKVISSEQLKHAIIKATEYVPHIIGIDNNSSRRTPSIRHMPIKYERTLRSPISSPVPVTRKMTSEYPKLTDFLRDKKQIPDVAVNFRSPCAEPVVVGKNRAAGGRNARKVMKRTKGSTKANTRLPR